MYAPLKMVDSTFQFASSSFSGIQWNLLFLVEINERTLRLQRFPNLDFIAPCIAMCCLCGLLKHVLFKRGFHLYAFVTLIVLGIS